MTETVEKKGSESAQRIFETSDKNTIEKLIKIGTALSAERNLHELLNMIVDELKSLISADKASLFLIDKEKYELVFHITSDEVLREQRLPMSRKSIAGYVAMTGETLRIDDVYELGEASPYKFNKEIDKQTGYRTTSMIALPMIDHKGERIGVVQLINKQVGDDAVPFDEDDERLLNALASQAAVSIENVRLYHDIEIFFASFVRALASAIEARDPVTKGHSRRVAMYAEATAKAMNVFSSAELKEILYAAWLHDVGKIGVREYILNKQNKLSDEEIEVIRLRFHLIKTLMRGEVDREFLQELEKNPGSTSYASFVEEKKKKLQDELALIDMYLNFVAEKNKPSFMSEADIKTLSDIAKRSYLDSNAQKQPYLTPFEFERLSINKGNLTSLERENMNSHVQYTWDILSEIPFTNDLRNVPYYASLHHEKLDGSGYPFGYVAEKIPVQARILAIVDIYDALTAQDRPYKKPMPQGKALDIIEEMVQSNHLDREVFISFIKNRIYELQDSGEEFTFLSTILTKAEELLRVSH